MYRLNEHQTATLRKMWAGIRQQVNDRRYAQMTVTLSPPCAYLTHNQLFLIALKLAEHQEEPVPQFVADLLSTNIWSKAHD